MLHILGRAKGAKILFEGGADTAVTNHKGHTLLQDAREVGVEI